MDTDARLKAKLKDLEFLMASSRALNATLDLDALLGVIIKLVRKAVNAEAASLLLLDADGEHLVFELARGRHDKRVRGLRIPVGEGLIGWVAAHKKPLVVNDAHNDPRYSSELERTLRVKPRSVLALPLMRRGKLIGVLDAINREDKRPFSEDDLQIATALGEHVATAVANAKLYGEAKRRNLEYSLLAKVGADFGRSLSLDGALERIIDSLGKLIAFDAAAIFLLDRREKCVRSVLHRGYPGGADEKIDLKSNQGVVGQAAKRKRGIIVEDVRKNPCYVNARPRTRSEMVMPVVAGGEVIGLFNLESDRVDAYSSADLRLLEAFAFQAGVAIERAHLYEERHEKRAIQAELRVARTVQEFFTPQHTSTVGAFKICGVNFSSLEVSGDYYDYFPLKHGRVAFAIADVAGKGMPASLIMSSFRASLHTVAPFVTSARQITERANQILLETVRRQDFVTAFIGVIDPATGELTYCNAGHNHPILMSPDGRHRLLDVGGPILGVFEDPPLEEGRFILGDEVLLCYTDGATEARDDADKEYGEDTLLEAVRKNRTLSPYRLGRALHAELKRFTGSREQTDDVTYLAIRRRGAGRGRTRG